MTACSSWPPTGSRPTTTSCVRDPGQGQDPQPASNAWFERLAGLVPNHLLATDPEDFPAALAPFRELLRGRAALVRKATRGALRVRGSRVSRGKRLPRVPGRGSGLRGLLPTGLEKASRLPNRSSLRRPRPRPATTRTSIWRRVATRRSVSRFRLALARDHAPPLSAPRPRTPETCGLLLADTKFELGFADRGAGSSSTKPSPPTPSRYWDAATLAAGERSPSPTTSSTSAIGSTPAAGTANRRRRSCLRRWSPGPSSATSRRSDGSPVESPSSSFPRLARPTHRRPRPRGSGRPGGAWRASFPSERRRGGR